MINNDAPYKLREIIMDTWPQLFWLKDFKKEKTDARITRPRGECNE
jgi:hypothetical protein